MGLLMASRFSSSKASLKGPRNFRGQGEVPAGPPADSGARTHTGSAPQSRADARSRTQRPTVHSRPRVSADSRPAPTGAHADTRIHRQRAALTRRPQPARTEPPPPPPGGRRPAPPRAHGRPRPAHLPAVGPEGEAALPAAHGAAAAARPPAPRRGRLPRARVTLATRAAPPRPQAPGLSAPPRAAGQLPGAAARRKGRLFAQPAGRGRGLRGTFRVGTSEGGMGDAGRPALVGLERSSTPRPGRTELQTRFCGRHPVPAPPEPLGGGGGSVWPSPGGSSQRAGSRTWNPGSKWSAPCGQVLALPEPQHSHL